jgi:hypothetical protein
LAIEICSYAFHPIEPCAFPKSLAVLFGKLLAVRLVSDMRDKHGAAVADHSWANQVAGDVRLILRGTGTLEMQRRLPEAAH